MSAWLTIAVRWLLLLFSIAGSRCLCCVLASLAAFDVMGALLLNSLYNACAFAEIVLYRVL